MRFKTVYLSLEQTIFIQLSAELLHIVSELIF